VIANLAPCSLPVNAPPLDLVRPISVEDSPDASCPHRFRYDVPRNPCFRDSGHFVSSPNCSAVWSVVWSASGLFGVIPGHSGAQAPPLALTAAKCVRALKKGLQSTPEYSREEQCERQELNLHGFPHWILSPARLPIPPLSQVSYATIVCGKFAPTSSVGFAPHGKMASLCSRSKGDSTRSRARPHWGAFRAEHESLGRFGLRFDRHGHKLTTTADNVLVN
jgi:hypothetical protein